MDYINMIWKVSTLLYTVLSIVESQNGFSNGEKSPVLEQSKEMIVVLEGETAVFPCVGTNMEGVMITWFKDFVSTIIAVGGQLTVFDERFTIEPLSTTGQEYLKITNITLNDTNKYTCMLNNIPPMMKDFELTVKAPAKIDKSNMMENYQYLKGDTKQIVCKAKGYPKPKIQWYFYKSKTIQEPETRDLVTTNERLILRNLSRADEGIYRCEAKNDAGEDMYEIYMQEVYKPKFVTSTKKTVAKLSSTVTLECEVESNPAADIHWQRNDYLLEDSWKYSIQVYAESQTKKISVLNIANADNNDKGLYLCIARNNLGRDNIKLYLTVEDPSSTSTSTAEAITTTTKTTHKPSKTTIQYNEPKVSDNLVISSSTPEPIVKDGPRTEASTNAGAKQFGNYFIGLLLSVLMKYLLS